MRSSSFLLYQLSIFIDLFLSLYVSFLNSSSGVYTPRLSSIVLFLYDFFFGFLETFIIWFASLVFLSLSCKDLDSLKCLQSSPHAWHARFPFVLSFFLCLSCNREKKQFAFSSTKGSLAKTSSRHQGFHSLLLLLSFSLSMPSSTSHLSISLSIFNLSIDGVFLFLQHI